jgi:hypothetical protein
VVEVDHEFISRRGAEGFAKCAENLEFIGDAADSILEQNFVEVDEQTEFFIGQFEIGEQLLSMDRSQFLNGFEFNDN